MQQILTHIKSALAWSILLLLFSMEANSQFYVSQKRCVYMPPSGGANKPVPDCNDPILFSDYDPTSTVWSWDFGDGSPIETTRNPSHRYGSAGNYTVKLTHTTSTGVHTVQRNIRVGTPPPQPKFYDKIQLDTTICSGSLKLDPYRHLLGVSPPGHDYLWFPDGQTSQSITVTKAGCYSVEVYDPITGCSRIIRANVKVCDVPPPSASSDEKWFFGNSAGVEFSQQTPPTVIPKDPLAENGSLFEPPQTNNPTYIPVPPTSALPTMASPAGISMYYDAQGKLLLFSNGQNVWNTDKALMPSKPASLGNQLNGSVDASQTSVIVPKSTCNECPSHQYYVFTINKTTKLLSYSVVDMRMNSGKGAIVEKDVPYYFPVAEKVTARITDDGKGFYVYAHEGGTNSFSILKIDSTGIKETKQALGLIHENNPTGLQGYMKLSPKGDLMAVAVTNNGKNYVEVYTINNTTGRLTLKHSIDLGIPAPPYVYGLEFTQSSEVLYVTLQGNGSTVRSQLYQLDLRLPTAAQISSTKKLIDESATEKFGALQMGPADPSKQGNKSIVMAVQNSSTVKYIANPDLPAPSPTNTVANQATLVYKTSAIGGTSGLGLPTITRAKPKQEGDGISAEYIGNCQNVPTQFSTQGICNPMKAEAEWDFGDGSSEKGLNVYHTYTQPGTYTVKLTLKVYSETQASKIAPALLKDALRQHCKTFTVVDNIYIKPTPDISLATTENVCIKDNELKNIVPIIASLDNPTYQWNVSPPIKTPNIVVSAAGVYKLEVTNNFSNGTICNAKKDILIEDKCEPRLFIPEVFSPNGDNVNDKFELASAHIKNFVIRIYNRWGEVLYEANQIDQPWDGTFKGVASAPGMYAYYISYESLDFPTRPPVIKTGSFLLAR